jgi:hypothetical protein
MKSRRWPFAVIALIIGGAAAGGACAFPNPSFAPDETTTDSGNDAIDPADARDAADGGEGGKPLPKPDVDLEGGTKDATTVPEGGQTIDAGPDAACCDCDTDGFNSSRPACSALPGPRDCDDGNKFVKPGQDFVKSADYQSTHMPKYDWDCSGTTQKQYNYGLAKCADQLKLSTCSNHQDGFIGDPPCGTTGTYVTACTADGDLLNLKCTETSDNRVQACH